MPPGRRPSRSREEFVAAGITFADEFGIDALTLRALGRALGASTTALYRYFPDKQALLSAMRDRLLARVMQTASSLEDPLGMLRESSLALRRTALAHPCLGPLLLLPGLQGPEANEVPGAISSALYDLGLRDRALVRAYRQLESFVVGSCIFDLAGAPAHLTDRLARLRAVDRPEFRATLANPATVEEVNEQAFEATLGALLASLTARVRQGT